VEATLVLAGLMVLFLAVLQLLLIGSARVYLTGIATDAARGAAVQDASVARQRLADRVPFLTVEEESIVERWDMNLPVVEVSVSARIPALLPWVPRRVHVVRHALIDQ
jgi:hypothetical protein